MDKQLTNNTFATLSKVGVKHLVSKKGKLDYISWADAWSILKTQCPTATRTVYEHEATGLNYFTDGRTAYVKVGITVNSEEIIDMLPVMDFRNKSVSIDNLTSMDVNSAIQRSTAKAIAMHGLGISLYSGEDIPSAPAVKPNLVLGSPNYKKVLKYVESNKELGADALLTQLRTKYVIDGGVEVALTVACK